MTQSARPKLTELFTPAEIRLLSTRSNAMGFAGVAFSWAVIVATLVMLAWAAEQPAWLAVPLFALGLALLAGRQLGLSILHHEAAHQTLFASQRLNDVVGDWLCARPVWNDLHKYRAHHFIHHRHTNQPNDPDLSLVEPFPTTRRSLRRKLARDLFGATGLKYLVGRTLMDAGVIKWTVANDATRLAQDGRRWWSYPATLLRNAAGMLITNGLFYAACAASGHGWLYGMWVLAYVTPFPLFLRIRSLAEHACTSRSRDMFENTRSTRAGFFARATVAPIRVNFHIEHHLMPGVPYFRLPELHRMLRERDAVPAPPSYFDVMRLVSSR